MHHKPNTGEKDKKKENKRKENKKKEKDEEKGENKEKGDNGEKIDRKYIRVKINGVKRQKLEEVGKGEKEGRMEEEELEG